MLEFNVGELTTRLRAALGVRGRMPLGLDEHVVPVALTGDVSTPPYRRVPVRGTATWQSETATVGSYAVVELHLGTFGTTPQAGVVFVVDSIELSGGAYVTASGVAVANSRAVAIFAPVRSNALTFQQLVTGERYPEKAAIDQNLLPIGLRNGTQATDPLLENGRLLTAPVDQLARLNPEFPLQGLNALRFVSAAPGSAANTSKVIVTVSGLFYATVGG